MFSSHVTGGFSVFAGVGERTREGNDLYKEMIESVRLFLPNSCPSGLHASSLVNWMTSALQILQPDKIADLHHALPSVRQNQTCNETLSWSNGIMLPGMLPSFCMDDDVTELPELAHIPRLPNMTVNLQRSIVRPIINGQQMHI